MIFFGSLFWDIFRKLKEKFHESTLLQQKGEVVAFLPQSWFSGKCHFFNSFLVRFLGYISITELHHFHVAFVLEQFVVTRTRPPLQDDKVQRGVRTVLLFVLGFSMIQTELQYLHTYLIGAFLQLYGWARSNVLFYGWARVLLFYKVPSFLFADLLRPWEKGRFFSANCELVWPCLTPHLVCLISPRQESYGPSREPLSLLWLSWT